jgi:HAD superfamily hydrolase (TIGR01549 family)
MNLRLHPKLATFGPALIIFDKDGTLIDFQAMWGSWAIELAHRLERATGRTLAGQFFSTLGFDPNTGQIAPDGHLAVTPQDGLRALTVEAARAAGLSLEAARTAAAMAWHIPDPVAMARPLADLKELFSTLRAAEAKIAVATSDDRALTAATLEALGVASLVEALACADDGRPLKPAPDMVLAICQSLNISPAKTAVVGDNVVDLQMARNAGAGLAIGVLSGVGTEARLAAYADLLLPTIAGLIVTG